MIMTLPKPRNPTFDKFCLQCFVGPKAFLRGGPGGWQPPRVGTFSVVYSLFIYLMIFYLFSYLFTLFIYWFTFFTYLFLLCTSFLFTYLFMYLLNFTFLRLKHKWDDNTIEDNNKTKRYGWEQSWAA